MINIEELTEDDKDLKMIDLNKPLQLKDGYDRWLDIFLIAKYNDVLWVKSESDKYGRLMNVNSPRLRNKPDICLEEKYKYFSNEELESILRVWSIIPPIFLTEVGKSRDEIKNVLIERNV